MLLVCISALVGTWSVRNRVLACRGVSVYVSICLSCTLHGLVQYRRVYRCDLLCVWDVCNASCVYLCSGWDMDCSESGVGVQRCVRLCVHLSVVARVLYTYHRVFRCDLLYLWDVRNASFVYLCSGGWDVRGLFTIGCCCLLQCRVSICYVLRWPFTVAVNHLMLCLIFVNG